MFSLGSLQPDPDSLSDDTSYIGLKDTLLNHQIFKTYIPTAFIDSVRYVNKLGGLFGLARKLMYLLYWPFGLFVSTLMGVIRQLVRGVVLVLWLLCEPFSLMIRVLEYNTHAFVDLWLGLLFDTKLENLLKVDYGVSQLKVIAHWVRFVNIMCIAGLVMGITTYYTIIRVIYWLTKLEKKHKHKTMKQKLKESEDHTVKPDLLTDFETFQRGISHRITHKASLLDEFLQRERITVSTSTAAKIASQEITPPATRESTIPIGATIEQSMFEPCFGSSHDDDDDDNIYNYESLNSLASGSSTAASSPLKWTSGQREESPVTQAFRSRLSSLNNTPTPSTAGSESGNTTSEQQITPFSTVGSSVFSTTRGGSGMPPMTPISTIEEDEEEDN